MNIAKAKEQIKDTVEAYLRKDEFGVYRIDPVQQRPLFLLGAPGIGKTAIVSQVAEELGIGLVAYSMTHHTRQSALGLPYIVHRDYRHGESFEVSEYTMSEIIASVYDYMEASGLDTGILFLDEVNCVSETLYPSMLQFLQFKTFGRHRVPEGWVIVCAGNPPEYNRSVHDFDIVTLDRMRKVEVEPDLKTWLNYARETKVHPAITTFLEVRPDDFYLVESTPEGKNFVSARGWSDLSEYIGLLEEMDKKVDYEVVAQFLQEREIAERFASYYELFDKYRSDYQVETILAGEAREEISLRVKQAEFDERLAVLSLMLDRVCYEMHEALEREAALKEERDELRAAKPALLAGASVAETMGKALQKREDALACQKAAGNAGRDVLRVQRRAIAALRALVSAAELEHVAAGEPVFELVKGAYARDVDGLKALVAETKERLDHAFAFIVGATGEGRELLVFVTELTARGGSARFLSEFGSDSYFKYNSQLMVEEQQSELLDDIDELERDYLGQ